MDELKDTAQEILQANNEWRSTFDAMDESVALLDAEGSILRCNKAMSVFLKKPYSGIIGSRCKEVCVCMGGHREQCPVVECRKTLKREHSVFNHGDQWFDISADPIIDEAGQLKGIVHILQDITEHKNLERALKAAIEEAEDEKAKTQSIIEAIGDGVTIQDRDFRILYQNQAIREMIGDHVGEFCYKAYEKREHRCEGCGVAQVFGDGGTHIVQRSAPTDQGVLHVEITASPLLDAKGAIIAGIEVVHNITKRKQAENAIRQSEERYRLLFQKSPIGVFQYDSAFRITDCNERFVEILKSTRENLINLDLKSLRDKRILGAVNSALQGVEGHYEGQYLTTLTNLELFVSLHTAPMFGQTGLVSGGIGIVEDITERVNTELRLQEQQRFSENLVQNSAVATFVLDAQHTVVTWNRACEELTRIPATEMIGTKNQWIPFYDHERPVLADIVLEGASADLYSLYPSVSQSLFARNGLHAEGWYRLDCRDCYLVFDAAPILDSRGVTIAAIETLQDITAHKLAEAEIRKSEERYRTVIENAFDMIQSIAPDGSFLYVNPAWLRTMGYSMEELSNRNIFDIIHPDCQSKCSNVFSRLSSGLPVEHFEAQFAAADGRVIDLEGSASVNLADGKVKSMQCILHDVTERKRLEEELYRSQQDWEYTFNSITDMVTVHDKDFNIILANKAAESILGLPLLENMKDRKCFNYYHGTDHAPQGCPSCGCLGTGEAASFEIFEPHLNMFIEIRAIPRFDSSGNLIGLIHVVRDITGRKKAESERERLHHEKEQLREQLLQSQKMEAVGTLAGGIAHDFNNILNVIIGYGGLLETMPGMTGKAVEFLSEITNAANRAAYLTRGLLAFSRKQHLELKPADLNDIIRSITAMLHRVIGEDVRMISALSEEQLVIICDAIQVEQIVVNLASNARDAMPKGGLFTLKTELMQMDEAFCMLKGFGNPGSYAVMRLTDTGIGMNEETRERIFDPFFTTKPVGRGTGLGLSIIYGIVTQHGGFLECESDPGHGTVFTVYLPLAATAESSQDKQGTRKTVAKGRGELILLAEDDESGRRLVKVVLEQQGYRVIEAVTGIELIEKFREHSQDISLILLDVIMPDMNGYDALNLIKEDRADIRALLMSGYTADILEQRGIKNMPSSFMKKPISPYELLASVREILDR